MVLKSPYLAKNKTEVLFSIENKKLLTYQELKKIIKKYLYYYDHFILSPL